MPWEEVSHERTVTELSQVLFKAAFVVCAVVVYLEVSPFSVWDTWVELR